MKKIRIISLLLTFIMVIGFLGACNGSSSDDDIVTVDSPYGKTFDLKPANGVDGDALMLIENGRTDYKIVISDTATTYEKTAGSEMQTFIQKSTGVKIPIISDNGLTYDNNNYYMSIGPTTLFDALAEDKGIDVNYDELGERGSIIHLEGNSLYLNGAAGYGTSVTSPGPKTRPVRVPDSTIRVSSQRFQIIVTLSIRSKELRQ